MKNVITEFKEISRKLNYILSKRQKKISIYTIVVILIGAGFETIGVSAIVPFVQAIMNPEKIYKQKYVYKFCEDFGIANGNDLILLLGIVVILIYIVKNLYLIFSLYVQTHYRCLIERETSVRIMESYTKRPYAYFLNISSGDVIRNVEEDVNGVYSILGAMLKIFVETITAIMLSLFIFINDSSLAIGLVVLALFCIILMTSGMRNILKKNGKADRKWGANRLKVINQIVNGIKEIKIMSGEEFFLQKYRFAKTNVQKAAEVQGVFSGIPEKLIEGVSVAGIIGIICYRIMGGEDVTILIPKLAAFAVAAVRILPSVSRITSSLNDFAYYKPAVDAVYRNLEEVAECEKLISKTIETKERQTTLKFNDSLGVVNVCWKYPKSEKIILSDINLKITKGESIALIGASGEGKSTLADIILGLLVPEQGYIEVDGTTLNKDRKEWNKMVGYVPQTVFLTDDTLRNNIAFGMEENHIDDGRIWEAIQEAQLDEYVRELPLGLDTMVGERGIRCSGGQRQRIAIARALFHNPEILVLDEATSALDTETEKALMDSIDALHGRKTLIIVAHRLSTIQNCDRVFTVKDGMVIEK